MSDRLDDIKEWSSNPGARGSYVSDTRWLVSEVERLQAENARLLADVDIAYQLIVDGKTGDGLRVLYCTPDPNDTLGARSARAPGEGE